MMYTYYHGIIDHSGINFKAYWWQPWQPGAIFHDNHHQYFHVNFGFNCFIWDKVSWDIIFVNKLMINVTKRLIINEEATMFDDSKIPSSRL